MNWDALGAIGELVGAVAVVATLAYLAVQIRQSNKLSRATAVQIVSQQNLEFLGMLATNPDLRELWTKGAEDYDKLDARTKHLTTRRISTPTPISNEPVSSSTRYTGH